MAENESGQDKTEDPTPKRLNDAKKKGQVARSKDLATMTMTLFGSVGILFLGPSMLEQLQAILADSFVISAQNSRDVHYLYASMSKIIINFIVLLIPFLLLMFFIAAVSPLLLGGWVFSAKSIAFKINKVNPFSGLKRIFSVNGLVELLKAFLKFVLVALIAFWVILDSLDQLLSLSQYSFFVSLEETFELLVWGVIFFAMGLVVIAFIDVPFQLFQHKKKLKMSKQEIRDEMKDTEGKPEVKSRIRQLQQQMAQSRMMEEVPNADVIIVNPTHFSVALRYDQKTMRAPLLVAKGTDLIAHKIQEVAALHEVEVVESAPLARSLFVNTDLNEAIPGPLYMAVAQVLAFVFQLRAARAAGKQAPPIPQPEIPHEYQVEPFK
ncbi:MAG: flagellar biosynthesis protein FlhB [Gammaproteobacteria bacterium]|nr:flagellar biosynthesis protein FlhB [Gammaproteobacteria bacterium]